MSLLSTLAFVIGFSLVSAVPPFAFPSLQADARTGLLKDEAANAPEAALADDIASVQMGIA